MHFKKRSAYKSVYAGGASNLTRLFFEWREIKVSLYNLIRHFDYLKKVIIILYIIIIGYPFYSSLHKNFLDILLNICNVLR